MLWVAHASRVLVAASRRNRVLKGSPASRDIACLEKFALARTPSPARERRALTARSPSRLDSFVNPLSLRCFSRNQELFSDLQFARIFNVIERKQVVIGDLELLSDCHRIVALRDRVSFARARRRFDIFRRRSGGGAR